MAEVPHVEEKHNEAEAVHAVAQEEILMEHRHQDVGMTDHMTDHMADHMTDHMTDRMADHMADHMEDRTEQEEGTVDQAYLLLQ